MPPTVLPPALKAGDRVALVSPSGPSREPAVVEEGVRRLMKWGLTPVMGKRALESKGYLAGDDAARAADFQAALDDPALKAIFCLRGGYGATRILRRLDWRPFLKRPKPIVGYSDITALLTASHRMGGIVGIHGPMVATKSDFAFDAKTEDLQKRLLFDARAFGPLPTHPNEPAPQVLIPGTVEGPLIGGNLSLLAALQGTPWVPDTTGAIVFIEDVEEAPYRVDRMLTQLAHAGAFAKAAGVVFGDFARCDAPPGTEEMNLDWVLRDRAKAIGLPCASGFPFGHRAKSWSLPYGARARLVAADPAKPARLELIEPAVSAR
jgi:muramoyltetrapeptide carboxypeptidase